MMNERVFKTVGLARAKADVVILGTSRTDIGIGREHQAFQSKRVFNLATFGQPIRESRRLMEVVLEHGKPQAIVARTVKGKGVSFMELNPAWHGVAPKPDELDRALKELDAVKI